jgi:hypothetical protein
MSEGSYETVNITSSHHWSVNIKLILHIKIEDEKKTIIRREWYNKDEPIIFGDTIKNGIDEAVVLFKLTGVFPGWLSLDNKKFSLQEIYSLLYAMPFSAKDCVRFIQFNICGCNMGYCGAIEGYRLISEKLETFGNVLSLWGSENLEYDEDGKEVTYYEYPDSVILSIENALEKHHTIKIYNNSCYKEPITVDLREKLKGENLDNKEYFTFSYTR